MDDLFSIGFWNQSTKPTGLNLCQVNSIECIHPVGENSSLFSIGGTLPQAANLPQFPADKAFVERAARSSSLSDSSIDDMMSHFQSTIICANASTNAEFEAQTEKNKKHKDNFYGLGAAKRKRNNEDMALDQAQVTSYVTRKMEEDKMESEQNAKPSIPSVATDKLRGKQTTDSIESSNDEFIHIRARRGQATNSHSLAERVRREKINERMKLLQNIVPGCSKITGKAVMLDEIINYVQSLQQQVEFLSMKLAAINPSLDIDIDSVLSKYSFNGMVNPPDSLGRSIDTQIAALYGYKESRLQMAYSNNVNLNAHGLQQ